VGHFRRSNWAILDDRTQSPKVGIVKGPLSWRRHFTLIVLAHPTPAGTAVRGSVAADFARIGRYRTTAIPALHDGSGARLHAPIMRPPQGSIAVHRSTFPWLPTTLQVACKLDERLKSTTTTIVTNHPNAENAALLNGPRRAYIPAKMKPGADMAMKTTTRLCRPQTHSRKKNTTRRRNSRACGAFRLPQSASSSGTKPAF
jgi:hypothetical protein